MIEMITAALIVAATQTPPVLSQGPTPSTEEEIVVIGRKLRDVRFRFRAKGGKLLFCRITKSTGDRILDRLTCDAARRCAALRPSNVQEMTTCMTQQREQVLAELRAAKNGKRP